METQTYPDYVSYDITWCADPVKCLMCGGILSKSAIEPSRVMRQEIANPGYHLQCGTLGSWLFTCDACHWWCVREGYEFIDEDCDHFYGRHYLVVGTAENNEARPLPDPPGQYAHPWLRALDDPRVYDQIQRLPSELTIKYEGDAT